MIDRALGWSLQRDAPGILVTFAERRQSAHFDPRPNHFGISPSPVRRHHSEVADHQPSKLLLSQSRRAITIALKYVNVVSSMI
jgi:hypothetical protein